MSRDDIDAVLAGDMRYDDLTEDADQAAVREVWKQRAVERIANLDLETEFRARGEQYSTMENGRLVRYVPGDAEDEYVDEKGIIVKVYVQPTES